MRTPSQRCPCRCRSETDVRIALCLPAALEGDIAREAELSGHSIVARCDAADELAAKLAADAPDAVVASAAPGYLNARLLAASDSVGARLITAPSEGRSVTVR